jgi:hypothetical protein
MNNVKDILQRNLLQLLTKFNENEVFVEEIDENQYNIESTFDNIEVSKVWKKATLNNEMNVVISGETIDIIIAERVFSHFERHSYEFDTDDLNDIDLKVLKNYSVVFKDLIDNINSFEIKAHNPYVKKSVIKKVSKKELKKCVMENKLNKEE